MAFIDELIGQGGLPYGMGIEEEPKAHDKIDSLIDDDLQRTIMNLVVAGGIGGAAGSYKSINALIKTLGGKATKPGKILEGILNRNKKGMGGIRKIEESRIEAVKSVKKLSEYIKKRSNLPVKSGPIVKTYKPEVKQSIERFANQFNSLSDIKKLAPLLPLLLLSKYDRYGDDKSNMPYDDFLDLPRGNYRESLLDTIAIPPKEYLYEGETPWSRKDLRKQRRREKRQ